MSEVEYDNKLERLARMRGYLVEAEAEKAEAEARLAFHARKVSDLEVVIRVLERS